MLRIVDLASSSRRMERPEQSSRHSLIPESWPSARFFDLNRFSATANVSRPGRSPASNVSFTPRRTVVCGAPVEAFCGVTCADRPCTARTKLTNNQNFIQTRLKVFLSLGPQANSLNRQSFLRQAHPRHQLLDILPRFLLIFAQILRLRHPHQEPGLVRMFGLRDMSGFRRKQPRVPGERMFEAQIGHKMA